MSDLLTPEQRESLASFQATCDAAIETLQKSHEADMRRAQQIITICEALTAANNKAAENLEKIGRTM